MSYLTREYTCIFNAQEEPWLVWSDVAPFTNMVELNPNMDKQSHPP